MSKTTTLALLLVAFIALIAAPGLQAQDADAKPDSHYHLAVAKTHSVHAADNVLLLKKYAAGHKTVPADVIKDHTSAMKYHLQAARSSYAKLAAAVKSESDPKNQAALLKEIDALDQRLAKVSGMVKTLETQTTKADQVVEQSAAIAKEMDANRLASQSVDNNFYNMDSSSYYETGLGHFTD